MHQQHHRLEAANVYLSLARELGVHVDTYELAPAVGSPQSVKKSLGLHKNDCCHVSMQGSGQGPRGRTLQDLSEQYHTDGGGGDIGGGGSAAVDQPCAILTARSQVPGSVELVVMPYNYPVLLPLLKRSSDMLKNSNVASSSNIGLQDQLWVTQFRKELSVYFLNIPANYYPKLVMLLKNLRLTILLPSNQQVAQNTALSLSLLQPLSHLDESSSTLSNTFPNISSHLFMFFFSVLQSSFDGKIHVTPFKQVKAFSVYTPCVS